VRVGRRDHRRPRRGHAVRAGGAVGYDDGEKGVAVDGTHQTLDFVGTAGEVVDVAMSAGG
jgi:hypothetical protein